MTIQLFSTLEEELRQLGKVSDESNFRKFLDHEDEQKRIADIFVRINEARVRFEVRIIDFFVRPCRLNVILCSSHWV